MSLESKFLILYPSKLIYTNLPKCASTTMHKVFLALSGIHTELEPREAVWGDSLARERERAGLTAAVIPEGDLERFINDHRDYFWMTVVRNPYQRCLSGYNQQIRRYAEQHERRTAWKANIAPYFVNPFRSDRPRRRATVTNYLKKNISFDKFLDGLLLHTPSFDRHFETQTRVTKYHHIRYNSIVKLERIEETLFKSLRNLGINAPVVDIPRINKSDPQGDSENLLTEKAIKKINSIYEEDFINFQYEKK